jgi:hypothetical protein
MLIQGDIFLDVKRANVTFNSDLGLPPVVSVDIEAISDNETTMTLYFTSWDSAYYEAVYKDVNAWILQDSEECPASHIKLDK